MRRITKIETWTTSLFMNIIFFCSLVSANGHEKVSQESILEGFIEPLGILTFTCLSITLALGLLMPRDRKKIFPWHRRIAFTTLISALTHMSFILLSRA